MPWIRAEAGQQDLELPRQLMSAVLVIAALTPRFTEDVAAGVTFLASPSAGYLTGQVIHVDGGAYLGL
jgi:NAD(P)-dependent dehydrogenase (short-subunit alcohol dehydrogenase family)